MKEIFIYFSYWLDPFFLIYFGIINLIYMILLIFGSLKIYQRNKELNVEDFTTILCSNSLPEISFILPVYNEEEHILSVTNNLINLAYRYKQIIVVNDGSTDNTFMLLQQTFELVPIPRHYQDVFPCMPIRGLYRSKTNPEMIVIDKENGTKFDALNAALNACHTLYFITVDADTFISDKDFEAIIRPMMTYPETIALGASVRISNGCLLQFNHVSTARFPLDYLSTMQSIEYLRAFLMRQGWDYLGGNFVLSGAFSIFSTEAVKKIGGFAPTFANDLEIIVRLHRLMRLLRIPYRISYLPDPVAWTEGPDTLKGLAQQRMVWHRGLLESLWFHKRMFFNPRYGIFGLFVYPFMVFGEALEPLVEILGYIYIIVGIAVGVVHPLYIFLFLCITWGFSFLFAVFCLFIEEASFKEYSSFRSLNILFWSSLVENFGYRQMTLIWRLRGFKSFFKRFNIIKDDNDHINAMIRKIKENR